MSNFICVEGMVNEVIPFTPEEQPIPISTPSNTPDFPNDTQPIYKTDTIEEVEDIEEVEEVDTKDTLEAKLKEWIDAAVYQYLGTVKEMFMNELITHLLDTKRKYEMEDNEFNKLTDKDKQKVNQFIKSITK